MEEASGHNSLRLMHAVGFVHSKSFTECVCDRNLTWTGKAAMEKTENDADCK